MSVNYHTDNIIKKTDNQIIYTNIVFSLINSSILD